jgi:hypothetical protein
MATFEQRQTKDGQTVYCVKIRRKGYPTQTATFTRLTAARKRAQVTEGAVLEGRHFQASQAKRHTLGEMIDRYLHTVLSHKSASSIYMQTLQLRWWKAHLGNRTLADMTPTLIAGYRDKLALGDGQPRSNATVVRYLAALSHAFTMAVREWGWLDESPMRKVRKPKESRGRVRFLSDDERQRLAGHPLQDEVHCYLYHRLYGHTDLWFDDLLRIGRIWVTIQVWYQHPCEVGGIVVRGPVTYPARSANAAGCLRKVTRKSPGYKSFPKDVANLAKVAGYSAVLDHTGTSCLHGCQVE